MFTVFYGTTTLDMHSYALGYVSSIIYQQKASFMLYVWWAIYIPYANRAILD
ncbi:hypothetical protein AGMMS49936_03120 [Endomicrobiia bacterium]|nr:hypothetical protein AGMMS49936_03120 [Endomicrobiia bacterium]